MEDAVLRLDVERGFGRNRSCLIAELAHGLSDRGDAVLPARIGRKPRSDSIADRAAHLRQARSRAVFAQRARSVSIRSSENHE